MDGFSRARSVALPLLRALDLRRLWEGATSRVEFTGGHFDVSDLRHEALD